MHYGITSGTNYKQAKRSSLEVQSNADEQKKIKGTSFTQKEVLFVDHSSLI